MELILLATLAALAWAVRAHDQRQRIAALAGLLAPYRIEAYMETLSQGYLRALGETDPLRSEPIWNLLRTSELALKDEMQRFAADVANAPQAGLRVSRWPMDLPGVRQLMPALCFPLKDLVAIHAQGLALAADNAAGKSARDRAFLMSAELFLLQHSCHWFCRSKNVASARLLVRHKTPYAQVLASVSAETRGAYQALVGPA